MHIHNIQLAGYRAVIQSGEILTLGTAGSYGNEWLKVSLGQGWQGLNVQVIFHPSRVACFLPENGNLEVPWEATAQPLTLGKGRIVFQGFNKEKLINSTDLFYIVLDHSPTDNIANAHFFTPELLTQVILAMGQAYENAASAAASASMAALTVENLHQKIEMELKDAKESGTFDGPQGERGPKGEDGLGVPIPTKDGVGKCPVVTTDGSGYRLAGPFAPLNAVIRPIVTGNPIVVTDSIEWTVQRLKLYGKAVQNGEPELKNPVSIIGAGIEGKVKISITDDKTRSQEITLTNELLGIPVVDGGNYTDVSGQQWVCDEVCEEKKVQRIMRITLDGSDDEVWTESSIQKGRFIITYPNAKASSKILSTQFQSSEFDDPTTGKCFCNRSKKIFFTSTIEEGVDVWREHLRKCPMTILYQLEKPIEIALTDQDIMVYQNLYMYEGKTVIKSSEDLAGIEVCYVADPQKYIDQRIK